MSIKYIHHIYTHLPFPYALSRVPTPRKDLFYSPVLHFFKVYINSPRGAYLGISDMYIPLFNQVNHPVTNSFSTTLLPYSTAYSALRYAIFIQRCNLSIFFTP
jgi:hypothetical protein